MSTTPAFSTMSRDASRPRRTRRRRSSPGRRPPSRRSARATGAPPTRECSPTGRTRRCCRRARRRAGAPAAKSRAMPTTCAIPPGSVCTLYVRSSSRIGSPPPRGASRPSPSRSIIWPAWPLPGDEQHLADTRQLQELQRVVDHRPAPDREQVLVRDARQLAQARRLAAGADEALRLHARDAKRRQWRAGLGASCAPVLATRGGPRFSAPAHRVLPGQRRSRRTAPRRGPRDHPEEPLGVEGQEQQRPHAGDRSRHTSDPSRRKGGTRHGEDQDEPHAVDGRAQAVRPACDDRSRASRGSPRSVRRRPQHLRPDVQGPRDQGQGGEGLREGLPEAAPVPRVRPLGGVRQAQGHARRRATRRGTASSCSPE